jgi:hypothetical protein
MEPNASAGARQAKNMKSEAERTTEMFCGRKASVQSVR